MVAHMTALQSSAEELERKIQLKHDESAKRYDLQLEQIREKAALVSRHTSAEDSLKVTPYEKMKWCAVCQVKVRGKRCGEVTLRRKGEVTEGIDTRGGRSANGLNLHVLLQVISGVPISLWL